MKKENVIGDLHERARKLIVAERVESLAPEERRWLADHFATCEACVGWAASTQAALQAFKSVSVVLPPGLAEETKLRVREQAARLKQQRSRNLALIVGCTLSWAAGVASAPLVWMLFEWLGTVFDLPRIVWELGFACWWFVPAAAAGFVILWACERAKREDFKRRLETGPGSNEW